MNFQFWLLFFIALIFWSVLVHYISNILEKYFKKRKADLHFKQTERYRSDFQ